MLWELGTRKSSMGTKVQESQRTRWEIRNSRNTIDAKELYGLRGHTKDLGRLGTH